MRSWARLAHLLVAGLFVACAIVQVFLAGLGVFDDQKAFTTHRNFGYVFGWLTLVILVLALVGQTVRRERAGVTAALDGQTLAPTTEPG